MLHISTHADERYLAAECGHGMMFPLSVGMLAKMLATSDGGGMLRADGSPRIRLVVLSACRSRASAEALRNAGVPHVICVNDATDVLETTCLAFVEVRAHLAGLLCLIRHHHGPPLPLPYRRSTAGSRQAQVSVALSTRPAW